MIAQLRQQARAAAAIVGGVWRRLTVGELDEVVGTRIEWWDCKRWASEARRARHEAATVRADYAGRISTHGRARFCRVRVSA